MQVLCDIIISNTMNQLLALKTINISALHLISQNKHMHYHSHTHTPTHTTTHTPTHTHTHTHTPTHTYLHLHRHLYTHNPARRNHPTQSPRLSLVPATLSRAMFVVCCRNLLVQLRRATFN